MGMQRISRREFVKRTAVTSAAFTSIPALLAACGESTGANKVSKLVVAAVQGNEDGPLKKVVGNYKSETGVEVQVVEFPYPQLFEKLVTTFTANGSQFDLCMMDDPWMPKFGTMGALQPLDSNFGFTRDSDIPTVVYDVGTWPPPHGPVPPTEQSKAQHLYGITIVGNVEMVMYRSDRSKLMATGKAYQSTVWPGEITGIVEDPTVSQVKGKVAYIPIPQGPSGKGLGMMGNWLLGIPKGSTKGAAAAEFIKWMLKPDKMRNYVAQGGIPIRKSILNDTSLASANPYFAALAKSFDAVPNWRPRTDQWNQVETIYGTQMNATVAGQITPQAAMQKAAADIRTLMKAAGYPSA